MISFLFSLFSLHIDSPNTIMFDTIAHSSGTGCSTSTIGYTLRAVIPICQIIYVLFPVFIVFHLNAIIIFYLWSIFLLNAIIIFYLWYIFLLNAIIIFIFMIYFSFECYYYFYISLYSYLFTNKYYLIQRCRALPSLKLLISVIIYNKCKSLLYHIL
jgi:hypothetical protein